MAPVRVRVLGPLEVERGSTTVPLGSPMQRRLLVALLLGRGATLSTDRLVEALWGADLPRSARNSLQTYVARLRTVLGDADLIRTQPPGYALRHDAVEVDADTFTRQVAAARALLDRDPAGAAADLEAALRTWRGEAYAEFADDLATAEAVRLTGLRAEARELLAAGRLRTGATSAALDVLDELVGEDPFRESAVRQRAEALALLGRRTDALAALRTYRERLADELGLDPTEAVEDLQRRLLRDEGPLPPATATAAASLPAATPTLPDRPAVAPPPVVGTPTLGRAEDLRRIAAALAESRLVTLVGPGGVGKTRLAAESCADAEAVVWIDLAVAGRTQHVVPAMADALGIAHPGGPLRDVLVDGLVRFRGLVVLDNCEHVLDEVAEVVEDALRRGGRVRLLATSRERLDVPGEVVLTIAPLPVPQPEAASATDPAVQLFCDRVRAAGGQDVAPALAAEVVAAVDGLPLAIELTAARAVALPVPMLLERLRHQPDLAAGTRRRRHERHGTLANVISWSHDLLDEGDRQLFDRLAVFASTFRLEDVERICADDDLPVDAVAPALARLVDQSMVVVTGADRDVPGRADVRRYRLLQPLRWFAAARLEGTPVEDRVRARQRQAVLDTAAAALRTYGTPAEADMVLHLEHALSDVRAVVGRAVASGDLATVAAIGGGLNRFSYFQIRLDVLLLGLRVADALDADPAALDHADPDDVVQALAAAAQGCMFVERYQRARRLAQRACDLATGPRSEVFAVEALGDVWLQSGHQAEAVAAYRRQVELAEQIGWDALTAGGETGLALAWAFHGASDQALVHAEHAVARATACGSPSALALAEYALAEALGDRDPDAALAAVDRARAQAATVNARLVTGLCQTVDVSLRGRHGDPQEALRRYLAALRTWDEGGAEGLVLIALRNLVILLVRIGADLEALTLSTALERVQDRGSFGLEQRRLTRALGAARERLGDAAAGAETAAAELTDLATAAQWAIGVVRRLGGRRSVSRRRADVLIG